MDHSFWHERWEAGQIGFHEGRVNSLLERHSGQLPTPPARLFLPLCGKTVDIAWLLSKGFRVAGAELSEIAIRQLFDELGVMPEVTPLGSLTRYSADSIDVFVGDIFDLEPEILDQVDAVYDRAALVALPDNMRTRYSKHLTALAPTASQLLITFTYDQSVMQGPPFSITADEVKAHYGASYTITAVETRDVAGGLKGICPATETIWLMQP